MTLGQTKLGLLFLSLYGKPNFGFDLVASVRLWLISSEIEQFRIPGFLTTIKPNEGSSRHSTRPWNPGYCRSTTPTNCIAKRSRLSRARMYCFCGPRRLSMEVEFAIKYSVYKSRIYWYGESTATMQHGRKLDHSPGLFGIRKTAQT